MTLTEKILARAAGREKLTPGELITCPVDMICVDEIQIGVFVETLERLGAKSVDPNRTIFVLDHHCPPVSLPQAEANRKLRDFAIRHGITVLQGGIKHQLLMEHGLVRPGMVLGATDSHINTCGVLGALAIAFGPNEAALIAVSGQTWLKVPETIMCEIVGELSPGVCPRDLGLFILSEKGLNFANYKALQFSGPTVKNMSFDGRLALCNMSTEMGSKNGIIQFDGVGRSYLNEKGVNDFFSLSGDSQADYIETMTVNAASIEPLVALPHSPDNVKPVDDIAGVHINQAFIGSCLGGNLDDLRTAAKILNGRTVHPETSLIVTPASRQIYFQAIREGLLEILVQANTIVSGMTCSVCVGLEAPLIAGDVCLSNSTRNFKGRMGSPEAEIYLASAATVAASAIEGQITDPRNYV